ncbi:MAG: DUF4253 domain-containing protein [Flavobacteriales bacterium]
MIIETKNVESVVSDGIGMCPACVAKRPCTARMVLAYFAVFSFPVFPIRKVTQYIECSTCTFQFNFIEGKSNLPKGQDTSTNVNHAIEHALIQVMLADGKSHPDEKNQIVSILNELFPNNLTVTKLDELTEKFQKEGQETSVHLSKVQNALNNVGKQNMIKLAVSVASIDGKINDLEFQVISKIGQAIGMSHLDFTQIMGKYSDHLRPERTPTDQLTETETELLNALGFNHELVSQLKQFTNSGVMQLNAIDPETGDVLAEKHNGVFLNVPDRTTQLIIKTMKKEFNSAGYLLYASETREGQECISIIHGEDDLEILKYCRVDGINHDVDHNDVISKIADWNARYGIDVIGCSRDWLEVIFERLPENIEEFADEVYQFCPDSVDQGVGDIETLQKMIKDTKNLWLWWD